MTDNQFERSPSDAEEVQSAAHRRWQGLPWQLLLGVALSAIAGSAVLGVPLLLELFAQLGKGVLTLDELKALGMLDSTPGPLEPVALNPLGWIALVLPLGLFAGAGLYRDAMRRLYLPAAALTGVSVALGLRFDLLLARSALMMAAIGAALCLHLAADGDPPTRAGKGWLTALGVVLVGQLAHLISESFLSETALSVVALAGFAGLIGHDLSRQTGRAAVTQAFEFYPSLAGLAVSLASLAR